MHKQSVTRYKSTSGAERLGRVLPDAGRHARGFDTPSLFVRLDDIRFLMRRCYSHKELRRMSDEDLRNRVRWEMESDA